ncbi:MAG: cation:proton antiporter [Elusimicrobiota bacterium]
MNLNSLFSLGLIFLFALVSSGFIKKIKLPTVTAYLLFGIAAGPSLLNIISQGVIASSGIVTNIVLSFIAFSLGQNFSKQRFREIGSSVISLTIGQVFGALIIVTSAIYYLTDQPLFVALSFGAIATATAPASVVMVVRESKAKGRFTDTLLGVVAFDDGAGLIIFALILAVAKSLAGVHENMVTLAFSGVLKGVIEIFGAIVIGALFGWMTSLFSRFVLNPSELLIYTLGFILVNAGLSSVLGVSVLLSGMVMGAVLVNVDKTSFKFFESLRKIDSPFYLLFFVLSGANLDLKMIKVIGMVGVIYIIARMVGKILGVFITSEIIGASKQISKYLGIGLAPQAGVALGMAMLVNNVFEVEGNFILSIIIASTVIFELFGPALTKYVLFKTKSIQKI